ncbi:DUF397 domain-containing protein [Nocardia macrotermitis]|uniref:DUF397 domain-containing protein n=1 Tax=Nocardia macrotermitis TaxID=2585198 RepID=A0A7K0D421_9NOCA|nr:DUF397 domain-containing protein [Nocardia macrotermitis]MQY20437.1 hypothetical protein [Nocardia macrotermitis]
MASSDSTDMSWRKSSYSGTNGGNCVEVRFNGRGVQVRDSKDKSGPVLSFTPGEWDTFVAKTIQ